MGTAPLSTIHLAVLADHDPGAPADARVCAVLAYDGQGRRHLHPIVPATAAEHLEAITDGPAPYQLQLPVGPAGSCASSSGRTWRTWTLPTIPTSLRTLPPQLMVVAFADQLAGEVAS
jgi:hypothetical protein